MLDHIHIQNYRLFKDLKIDKLGQVNLIAGKNNTGKTALLEALRIWDSKANINVLTNILFNRHEIINREPNNGYNLFRDTTKGIIEIGDDKKGHSVKFAIEFKFQEEDNSVIYPFQYGINGDGIGYNVFNNIVYIPFLIENDENPKMWEKVSLTTLENDVNEIMKIIEPRIERIGFTNGKFMVLTGRYPNPFPLKKLGDGANRLFTVALALVNAKNKILLIDEFEVGLHHSVQDQLWDIIFKYAKEWNIQVFATTHSRDTVKSFTSIAQKEEYKDMANYFRLQKLRNSDDIVAVQYNEQNLKTAIEQDIETR